SELDSAKEDLRLHQERVTTYQGISKAAEEELARLNSTYDVYKTTIEAQLDESQKKVQLLERENTDIKQQLETTARELSDVTEKLDAERGGWETEKKVLEERMETLRVSEATALRMQQELREDAKKQNQIARDAQMNYERELVEHSKHITEIGVVRNELSEVTAKLRDAEQQARVAEANLNTAQTSWDAIKAKLEQEIDELKRRSQDLTDQNNILHSQLEQVSAQALQIREKSAAAAAIGEGEEAGGEGGAAGPADELREVVRFLRRERDILQTKHELALQEGERLKKQVEHLQKSLDETRALLDEERKRSEDALGTERKHAELMEKINQLNILRESNVTLREQNQANMKRVETLSAELEEARGVIGPLKEEVGGLQAEVEARKAEIGQLEEDNKRWKGRTQQILAKYERIDPVEHQKLKEEVATLRKEKEDLQKAIADAKKETDEQIAKMDAQNKELVDKSQRWRQLVIQKDTALREKDTQLNQKQQEIDNMKRSTTATSEVEQLQAEKELLVQQTAKLKEELDLRIKRNTDNVNKFKAAQRNHIAKTKDLEQKIAELEKAKAEKDTEKEAALRSVTEQLAKEKEELRKQLENEYQMRWSLKYSMVEKQAQKFKGLKQEADVRIAQLEEVITSSGQQVPASSKPGEGGASTGGATTPAVATPPTVPTVATTVPPPATLTPAVTAPVPTAVTPERIVPTPATPHKRMREETPPTTVTGSPSRAAAFPVSTAITTTAASAAAIVPVTAPSAADGTGAVVTPVPESTTELEPAAKRVRVVEPEETPSVSVESVDELAAEPAAVAMEEGITEEQPAEEVVEVMEETQEIGEVVEEVVEQVDTEMTLEESGEVLEGDVEEGVIEENVVVEDDQGPQIEEMSESNNLTDGEPSTPSQIIESEATDEEIKPETAIETEGEVTSTSVEVGEIMETTTTTTVTSSTEATTAATVATPAAVAAPVPAAPAPSVTTAPKTTSAAVASPQTPAPAPPAAVAQPSKVVIQRPTLSAPAGEAAAKVGSPQQAAATPSSPGQMKRKAESVPGQDAGEGSSGVNAANLELTQLLRLPVAPARATASSGTPSPATPTPTGIRGQASLPPKPIARSMPPQTTSGESQISPILPPGTGGGAAAAPQSRRTLPPTPQQQGTFVGAGRGRGIRPVQPRSLQQTMQQAAQAQAQQAQATQAQTGGPGASQMRPPPPRTPVPMSRQVGAPAQGGAPVPPQTPTNTRQGVVHVATPHPAARGVPMARGAPALRRGVPVRGRGIRRPLRGMAGRGTGRGVGGAPGAPGGGPAAPGQGAGAPPTGGDGGSAS
ncbi:hypothetical protein HK102_010618, partial [Quaeritorhiza haematococci]